MWNSYSGSVLKFIPLLAICKSPTISLSYLSTQTGRFKLGSPKKYFSWMLPVQKTYTLTLIEVLRERDMFSILKKPKEILTTTIHTREIISSDGFISNLSDFKSYLKRDLSLSVIPTFESLKWWWTCYLSIFYPCLYSFPNFPQLIVVDG